MHAYDHNKKNQAITDPASPTAKYAEDNRPDTEYHKQLQSRADGSIKKLNTTTNTSTSEWNITGSCSEAVLIDKDKTYEDGAQIKADQKDDKTFSKNAKGRSLIEE